MNATIKTERTIHFVYSKTILMFLFSFLFAAISYTQTSNAHKEHEIYKRISIENANSEVLKQLNEIGVDLSCGAVLRNENLFVEVNSYTRQKLDEKGISYAVLIEDMSSYYAKNAAENLPKARKELQELKENSNKTKGEHVLKNIGQYDNCDEIDWAVPANFNLNPNTSPNSFGGCLTYTQVLQELDDMRAMYPNLISDRLDASPSNQTTIEGRTIYYVRISDNPDLDEPTEPETLYQSLIHSREAASIMQSLYYMWYLLENYASDPDIKKLVDNQAMYFIPVVNPDGFVYNEIQNPDGGGMQRKNRNVAGGGCSTFQDGIDLNRNSAYYWGNGGSSTDPCSGIYMGASPFSENETQIMRDFFLEHDFKLALNHHSYKNAMLHGYAGTSITNPRSDEYSKYNHDMTYYNRYAYGPSSSISYFNSGNMNDWMMGGPAGTSSNGTPTGTGSGKNTLAWTPENGNWLEGGFWPLPSNFVLIAQRAMRVNFLAAYFSGKFAKLHDLNQSDISSLTGDLNFGVENLGQTASDFTVTVTPVSSNITSTGIPVTLSGMTILEQQGAIISYALSSNIQPYDTIEFNVTLSNDYASGNVLYETNVVKIYQPNLLASDDPDTDGLINWTPSGGTWSITSDSYSGTSAITSTTAPPYSNTESKTLQLNNTLDFNGAEKVLIQYFAKWDLERSFDYVQIEGSTDGNSWTPLCGKLTKPGAPDENNTYSNRTNVENYFQPDFEALYDGDTQDKWNLEEITIDAASNSFLLNASTVYLRFNFNTDESNFQDSYYSVDFEGFTFDDFKCILINEMGVGLDELNTDGIRLYPNPTNGQFTLDLGNSDAERAVIYNAQGKEIVSVSTINTKLKTFELDTAPGIYFMHLQIENGVKAIKLILE